MTRAWMLGLVSGVVTPLVLAGCAMRRPGDTQAEIERDPASPHYSVRLGDAQRLVANVYPTQGRRVRGTVVFTRTADRLRVQGIFDGLEPFTWHGIHVHEYGDCSARDASSAGDHYAPQGNRHGLPPAEERHAGDLGNLYSTRDGTAVFDIIVDNASLTTGPSPVIGRAIVVHENRDTGGQPSGDAGGRLACGVIGVGEAEAEAVSRADLPRLK